MNLDLDPNLYGMVLVAGLGAFVLGWLFIIRAGFKAGFFAGLVTFVPLLNIIFVGRNWERAGVRNGLLLSIVGLLVAGVGYYGGGDAPVRTVVEPELEARGVEVPKVEVPVKITRPQDVEVPNQAEAEAAGVDTTTSVLDEPEIEPGFVPEGLSSLESIPAPAKTVSYDYQPSCIGRLPKEIGKPVRLEFTDGQTHDGTLVSYLEETLVLAKKMTGGEAEFSYPVGRVARVLVYDSENTRATRARECAELSRPAPAATEAVQ